LHGDKIFKNEEEEKAFGKSKFQSKNFKGTFDYG